MPRALLLMAYGGPDRLEDVEPFLADIRGGRPTSPELVEEIRDRYRAIGGGSPLLEATRAQAAAVEARLNATARADGEPWRVFVGMRHWRPRIRRAVEEMTAAGCREGVAMVLAPHYSRLSVGAYMARLDEAMEAVAAGAGPAGDPPRLARVERWGSHPGFLDAVAEKVEEGLVRFRPLGAGDVEVIFTAHSLPERIVAVGDPYPEELLASSRAVAGRCRLPRWRFCWQSAGAGGGPWLGPPIEEVVAELAAAGRHDLLVVPIGFVSDHVEVLYDLDVEARGIAEAAGARLERTESLNDSPRFVAAVAEVVREAARGPA